MPVRKVAQAVSSEEKLKVNLPLAIELVRANELDQFLRKRVFDMNETLKLDIKGSAGKLKDKTGQMILLANDRYDKAQQKTTDESVERVAQLFAKTFSAAEIKYLTDLTNNPLNKKFLQLMKSAEFNKAMNFPYEKFSILMNEARTELKIPTPAPKSKKKKN